MDFNFFVQLADGISKFSQNVYDLFFNYSFRTLILDLDLNSNVVNALNNSAFGPYLDMSLFFGLCLGALGIFLVYTFIKWILDIIF